MSELQIPVLTEAVGSKEDRPESGAPTADEEREALIAELQTRIAASTFTLTEDIMRTAFAEMEASIFERITGRLRRELPEMIDTLLRERLSNEQDI